MRGLVIIPTYNECENIAEIIAAVLVLDEHLSVLVVDDNSPDGTAALVKAVPEFGERVDIIERPGKMGLGSAYIRGFQWALEHPEIDPFWGKFEEYLTKQAGR